MNYRVRDLVQSVSPSVESDQLSFCNVLPLPNNGFKAQWACFGGGTLEPRALFRSLLAPTPPAGPFGTLVAEFAPRPVIALTEAEEEGTVRLLSSCVCGGKSATRGQACDLGDMRLD